MVERRDGRRETRTNDTRRQEIGDKRQETKERAPFRVQSEYCVIPFVGSSTTECTKDTEQHGSAVWLLVMDQT